MSSRSRCSRRDSDRTASSEAGIDSDSGAGDSAAGASSAAGGRGTAGFPAGSAGRGGAPGANDGGTGAAEDGGLADGGAADVDASLHDGGAEPDASLDAAADAPTGPRCLPSPTPLDGGSYCKPGSPLLHARYRLKAVDLIESWQFDRSGYAPTQDSCPDRAAAVTGWLELSPTPYGCSGTNWGVTATITLDTPTGYPIWDFPASTQPWELDLVGSTATEITLSGSYWPGSLEDTDQMQLEVRIDRATGAVTDLKATYRAWHPSTGWNIVFDAKGALDCSSAGGSPSLDEIPEPSAFLDCATAGVGVPPFPNGDPDCYYETIISGSLGNIDCTHPVPQYQNGLGIVCGGYRIASCTSSSPAGSGYQAVCCTD